MIAKVRYVGRKQWHSRRCPSGEQYSWSRGNSGRDGTIIPISELQDAEYLAEYDCFEVKWTPTGEIMRQVNTPMTGIDSMLSEWGYRRKQKLAKHFGIKANQSEEDLDDALGDAIEELERSANE